MAEYTVSFEGIDEPVHVPTGTLLVEAAQLAGLNINQPCGGQGRCGRCAVQVCDGTVRNRSTVRLSKESLAAGYVLSCQSVIENDVSVVVPPQDTIERNLVTDRTVRAIEPPPNYNPAEIQSIQRINLTLSPPSMDDQIDDWERLALALRQKTGIKHIHVSLAQLRDIGTLLRQGGWKVTAVIDTADSEQSARLISLTPGHLPNDTPLWGVAIDIGTTTVSVWLVNLLSGEVHAQLAEYNGQITRGEDIISRIIYSSKNNGNQAELRNLVLETINSLLAIACKRKFLQQDSIVKATVAGNSTMIHLLLGISAENIRLSPFVTTINAPPLLTASEVGLDLHPEATVNCLPGIASYVGADITAGVLSSGQEDTERISLFIDVGTNGEMVLGNQDWLVACACSAGPAFEGAGVMDGMRATRGAIEEIWINDQTFEPTYRVIGNVRPHGICGSGLISLLAEMFLTGVVDKGGNINTSLSTPRTRNGEHGPEYVLVWADDTQNEHDIVITRVDIDNLLRAKAAIFAGIKVLADKVGIPLEIVEQIMVGGAFGKYINVEKAVEIGLFPDKPWDDFHFLGNTSVKGAYLALLDNRANTRLKDIASRMTYIELSADNSFYEAFTSALFLPHTDLSLFPTVQAEIKV